MEGESARIRRADKGKQRASSDEEDATTSSASAQSQAWLSKLNAAQREAVTWSKHGGLQILAGPGSGKTRVLTCRVAYLIEQCGLRPEDLIVVTFTNKAANEMKHRLHDLLGPRTTSRLTMMGTFHSVAVKYLRRYGKSIDLQNNFVIADQSDCQHILKPILEQHNRMWEERSKEAGLPQSDEIKVKVAQETISKSKARGISADQYLANAMQDNPQSPWKVTIGEIYTDYEAALRSSNTLDFDDLLVFCERLFKKNPNCVKNVSHVLVDEFQDTNTIQYNIVKLMAASSGSLSIVGDPDQSIYSWRSAEVENLAFMLKDFPRTHQVFLEENYRSTSSILAAALAVVQQDTERIQKSLRTGHAAGAPVVLREFVNAQDEASYIAYEIKRAVAQSGNQLNHNDFAILLRYNALSRSIEAALQSAGIPSRMIGGHKFFERAEIKDIIAYLQLAENPSYAPAFSRIINVPKRGIGDKSLKDIVSAAKEKKISSFEVVSRALKGSSLGNIKPGQKAQLGAFVKLILKIRDLAIKGASVSTLIDIVIEGTDYKGHLERTHGVDAITRLENINELKNFAEQLSATKANDNEEAPSSPSLPPAMTQSEVISLLSDGPELDDDGFEENTLTVPLDDGTPLRTFLESSMLATDAETQEAKDDKTVPKVTISTCHAAKGLEWPVVFVPAVESGVYPAFQKSEATEVAEERRLLYVAMTRAQAILHLTHAERRMERGQTTDKYLTSYLEPIVRAKSVPFSSGSITFNNDVRSSLCAVTGRPAVEEGSIKGLVENFHANIPAPTYSQKDDARFTSQYPPGHPHVSGYGKPVYPGQQWRINSYAGDDVRRYANKMPNKGLNPYASAFSTSAAQPSQNGFSYLSARNGAPKFPGQGQSLTVEQSQPKHTRPQTAAEIVQASGFRSALSATNGSCMTQAVPNPSASFQTVRPSSSGFKRPHFGSGLNKPFKPPSMMTAPLPAPSSAGHAHVSTVETRLTQQDKAVILNPVAPNLPRSAGNKSHTDNFSGIKDDSFSFLRGLAKEEMDDIAPRAPVGKSVSPRIAKKRSSNSNDAVPGLKRSKS